MAVRTTVAAALPAVTLVWLVPADTKRLANASRACGAMAMAVPMNTLRHVHGTRPGT